MLGGEHLRRLLLRKKEQRYYTIPWPVADYDALPQHTGPGPSPHDQRHT